MDSSNTQRQSQRTNRRVNNTENNTNVSDLLEITEGFGALGSKLDEALRFLGDFLNIFKSSKDKATRAMAMLSMMQNIHKYDF